MLEEKLGTNPYKFGFTGATDSHTSLSTAEENNFFGKHSGYEPSPKRLTHPFMKNENGEIFAWQMVASGYTGVWAKENTREAIWDAMERKEVYATTGPRMTVRFFGGWDYTVQDLNSRQPAFRGYEKGVPMGGDLNGRGGDSQPTFMVYALRDAIGANLDRIQIVKGLLDFSRQSASTARPTPVNKIVRNACRIVEHQLSIQKIQVDMQLPEESPMVNADMMQIEQVVVNLLVNAADAIGEAGGTITIDTGMATAADGINGRASSGGMVRIRVTDTGCGIPAKGLNKLFEPFYSTKGAKGTGLGLAIVWGIIEKHHGQIKVDSKLGGGTTLTILLPVAKSAGVI